MSILGIDVGGANIKVAAANGWTHHAPFPLWKHPEALAAKLSDMLSEAPRFQNVALTMTGELCDCFETKRDGVRHIIQQVNQVFGHAKVDIFQTNGRFVSSEEAIQNWALSAASNWRATSGWAALTSPHEDFLLVDIGSTTIDLIPVAERKVVARGMTDQTRLEASELLYLGMERTPLCSLLQEVTFRGKSCTIAREFFATTRDAQTLLGYLPEDATDRNSADGKPNTKVHAYRRITRMICCDETEMTYDEAVELAKSYFLYQAKLVGDALKKLATSHARSLKNLVSIGYGDELLRAGLKGAAIAAELHRFADFQETSFARCAPAFSVAKLLERELA